MTPLTSKADEILSGWEVKGAYSSAVTGELISGTRLSASFNGTDVRGTISGKAAYEEPGYRGKAILSGDWEGVFNPDTLRVSGTLQISATVTHEWDKEDEEGNAYTETKTETQNNSGSVNGSVSEAGVFKGKIAEGELSFRMTGLKMEMKCNQDLDSYSNEVRKKVTGMLLDAASKRLYKLLTQGLLKIDKRAIKQMQLNRLANYFKYKPVDGNVLFKTVMDKRGLSTEALREIGSKIGNILTILDMGEAASAGAYKEVAIKGALAYIGGTSNVAGALIMLGQAAKADWDAFAKRVHEAQFRDFYNKIYDSGRRNPKKDSPQARKARLKSFTEEAYHWLEYGGVEGARFRKMLMDYAYYTLERSYSRNDFKLVDGGLSNSSKTVLAALFNSFEGVYKKDLKAARTRKFGKKQSKDTQSLYYNISNIYERARSGNFSGVWSSQELKKILCGMLQGLGPLRSSVVAVEAAPSGPVIRPLMASQKGLSKEKKARKKRARRGEKRKPRTEKTEKAPKKPHAKKPTPPVEEEPQEEPPPPSKPSLSDEGFLGGAM